MSGERFVSIDEIESTIRQLKDVLSCRVVADQRGAIQEIHVLVSSNRAPKQTVRDIESAVMAKLGLSVDHRKISVAQMGPTEPSPVQSAPPLAVSTQQAEPAQTVPAQVVLVQAPAEGSAQPSNGNGRRRTGRLRFCDVTFSVNGSTAQATVRLRGEDQVFTGTAEGPNTAHNQLRLVVTATLAAVQQAWSGRGAYVLGDVTSSVQLAGKRVVVALIDVLTERGEETLTGSALVKQDLWKTAVNASLDATNRHGGLESKTSES